ncbi:copal-8-ol diphosphate hydratase, chloroplastic-like isoform X1 [Lycium ferocissimum]|uniref:copal-8-ol diphosphate hydratase, chloroplastic-like isoform X1 n=1 Tax=Lycium ferocissimum TaxID=112874 RepID=UPI0028166417|nr:copal-8-ol diphosphate hydratase, chloroplastic-like isoform X1 [Lycium ferocissimum]
MHALSKLKSPCHLPAVNVQPLLSAPNVRLFFKHVTRNCQFQTEGSVVYKKICCKHVPNAGNSLGYSGELQIEDTKYLDGESIQVTTTIKKRKLVEKIKHMLNTMNDGSSSVSPYDTAWVALIRDTNGSDRPQFPSCLQWIVDNQLSDGSWGEESLFNIYDRLLNTLASVVALTTWNTGIEKRNKGVSFIKENICKLETGNVENMTCGFEIVFPALLEKAQPLDIDIPYDAPVLKNICARGEMKFKRIPKDLVHTIPTTLLFSLEGFRDLDWERLLKLQMPDGSFLTSIASTAFAFMETNDENCLRYLQRVVRKYNGGAPHSYPVDMQARLWAIDRLQHLGISYYFEEEFKDMLDHVQRYWNEEIGIFSGRNSNFCDIDDTCMAIRLLRLHGYDVNPDVLNKFRDGDKFFCLKGETDKSPTAMYNLYRCSQVSFPGEKILDDANKFTYNFLQECLLNNQSLDKWLIAKDIPGEIRYALDIPWYASLPRVEARLYIEQYGGSNDIWIGKTLHRMPDISNNVYLEAAKLDYNKCQSQHQFEWTIILDWFTQCNFEHFGISKKELLVAYFLGAASIFELERSRERLAWAKSLIMCKMITSYFSEEATISTKNSNETRQMLLHNLLQFLHQLSEETYETLGKDIHLQLHSAWGTWLMSVGEEKTARQEEAELLVRTINLCGGHMVDDELISSIDYKNISNITNKVCYKLQSGKVSGINSNGINHNGSPHTNEVELDMKELVKLVLDNSSCGINKDMKKTFFAVAKTFYYTAHVTEEVLNFHISKVLFEPVE